MGVASALRRRCGLGAHRRGAVESAGHHFHLEHVPHHRLAREIAVDDEALEPPIRARRFAAAVARRLERIERGGKTYLRVKDYSKMREGVGMLLAELMRIKAEGDYAAIKALVDRYGLHFEPGLRDQVLGRYRKLNLPTYWAGINADLTPKFGASGEVTSVSISYPRDFAKQQLEFASMYGKP